MTTALWGKDIDICQCVCIISVDMIPSENKVVMARNVILDSAISYR